MRLSQQQIAIIETTVHRHFGRDVKVYLFGSRTDPFLKGGDIDLLLEDIPSNTNNLNSKIALIIDLKKQLGEQKIDVVLRSDKQVADRFYKIIDKSKTRIC